MKRNWALLVFAALIISIAALFVCCDTGGDTKPITFVTNPTDPGGGNNNDNPGSNTDPGGSNTGGGNTNDNPGGDSPVVTVSPPEAPTEQPIVTPADKQLTVQWDVVGGATSYEVWKASSDPSSDLSWAKYGNDVTGTSVVITGLTNGEIYYVYVKAKNSGGTSDPSPIASGTPVEPVYPPAVPGRLQVKSEGSQLTVKWDAVEGATSYEVSSNLSPSLQDVNEPSVTFEIPISNTYYNISVAAKNRNNGTTSAFSSPVFGFHIANYKLSYDGKGGTLLGGTTAGNIGYGTTVTLPASGIREGYTLKDFTLSCAPYTKTAGETFDMPTADVTVTANWTPISYTLRYDPKGGTLSGVTEPESDIEYGKTVTLPSSGTWEGHTLVNFTLSGALIVTKNPGETFAMPAGTVTVTANWSTDSNLLTYNGNGGALSGGTAAGKIEYGTSVTLPFGTRTGYTLEGFTLSGALTGTKNAGETFPMPAGAVTVTANWRINSYQLSYNNEGGTVSGGTAPGNIVYDTSVTLPSGTRTGYTLEGFTLSGALTGTKNAGETFPMPAGAVTVTANWKPIPYKLSYDPKGGTLSGGTEEGNIEYGTTVTLPSGTWTGHTLINFTLSGVTQNTMSPGETFAMPAGAVIVTANWSTDTNLLTYNGNGGELSGGTEEGKIEFGTTVTLPTSGTRTGYTLEGFTLSGAQTGPKNPGETFTMSQTFPMPAGAVTVTANWTINTYTLSYNNAGGDLSGGTPAGGIVYGTIVTLPSGIRTGHTLINFTLSGAQTGPKNPGYSFNMPAGDVTVTANWTPNRYQLSYNGNGGDLSDDTMAGDIVYGTIVTLPSGTRTGYTLTGFTLNDTSGALSGTKNVGETFPMPAGAVTVTANWTINTYTLSYNNAGGDLSGGTPAGGIVYDTSVTLPTSGTRTGYTLTGFNLNYTSGILIVTKNLGDSFPMPAGDVKVTANWTPNRYQLSYETNDGKLSGGTAAGNIEYGTIVTLPTGTKTGHTLTDFTISGAQPNSLPPGGTFTMPAGNVSVTANWTVNNYKLSYETNGGTLSYVTEAGDIVYGTTVTLPASGTRDGYTLINFTLSGALSGTKALGGTFTMPAGNVSVTANWHKDSGIGIILGGGPKEETIGWTNSPAARLSWGANDSLTVSVNTAQGQWANGASFAWSVDGAPVNGAAENTLTIYAQSYAEGTHTLTAKVTKDNVTYSKILRFTVTQ